MTCSDTIHDQNQSYCFVHRSSSRTTNEGTISDSNTASLVQVPTQSDISAEIILSEHFFSTINWGLTLSNLKSRGEQTRNILGARVIESDLPWRYFVKKSQQMIDMQ